MALLTGFSGQGQIAAWDFHGQTHPVTFAATTFDFFFVKGLGKPIASMWKAAEDASDHQPVVLKIEIPDRSAP